MSTNLDPSQSSLTVPIHRHYLVINPSTLTSLVHTASPQFNDELSHLHARLVEVYGGVNMGSGGSAGARMVLDSMLLSLRRIITQTTTKPDFDLVILPQLNIPGNPTTTIDYAVVRYALVDDFRERLLDPDPDTSDIIKLAHAKHGGRILLIVFAETPPPGLGVDTDTDSEEEVPWGLHTYRGKALNQAMALATASGLPEIRFCITSACQWLLCLLRKEEERDDLEGGGGGRWVCYESAHRGIGLYHHHGYMTGEGSGEEKERLGEVMVLLTRWLEGVDEDVDEGEGDGLFRLKRKTRVGVGDVSTTT